MNSSNEPSSTQAAVTSLPQDVILRGAGEFLQELTNLDTSNSRALRRFTHKYRDWLAGFGEVVAEPSAEGGSRARARSVTSRLAVGSILQAAYNQTIGVPASAGPVINLAKLVRYSWRQPTALDREVGLLSLLQDFVVLHATDPGLAARFRFQPLTIVLLQAIHIADRMRVCGNLECPAPYFIARRRSQRYCTEECAKPAQQAHKRAWWKEHGDAWRRNRRKPGRKAKARNQRRTVVR
jgi:hypothetical protein